MRNWKISTLILLTITAGAFFIGRSSNNEKEKIAIESTTKIAASAPNRGTELGNLAPEFQLVQMNGAGLSLADLSGQPAVLVFWASWCGFCRDEALHVNKLADAYASRGVRVFGINVRESQARTEAGIKDFRIRYAVLRDIDGTTARNYKVEGIPTVFFLDSKGIVRYVGNGVPADYAERLDALLAERD
ncbi:MAG TPA: TlpA disulfide reductase family protein [Pyrinomonadaceae bacterium]|nr:TlpA disulfide reductase family protein [Pyrinomonadaceae bacterium]